MTRTYIHWEGLVDDCDLECAMGGFFMVIRIFIHRKMMRRSLIVVNIAMVGSSVAFDVII